MTYNDRMPVGGLLDSVLNVADQTLRTLFAPAGSTRLPELPAAPATLSAADRRLAAGLMRVNHAGEIAAQGLYRGQAALSRTPAMREFLEAAADQEAEHLAWCESRLRELGSRPSLLNPLWYLGSFGLGAAAALLGDAVSLGFMSETEAQVEGHLEGHLQRLPAADLRSRRILEAMRAEEAGHGQAARMRGAATLPAPIPGLMRLTARLMTGTAYWL
jgi:ubiquinone biosynthesis monooxygenase Coq7